jgi:hypothetical protein
VGSGPYLITHDQREDFKISNGSLFLTLPKVVVVVVVCQLFFFLSLTAQLPDQTHLDAALAQKNSYHARPQKALFMIRPKTKYSFCVSSKFFFQ